MPAPGIEAHRLADAEAVCQAAADLFLKLARAAILDRGGFMVALSGGSTPKRLYDILASAPYRDRVSWRQVQFFWGDERCVGPDDPDSNYRLAREHLLDKLPIQGSQIHRMPAERSDLEQAARDYQLEIASAFGCRPSGPPPSFDLILLGMGPDGHTASLFPYTAALAPTERWVAPNLVPKLNANRMTLTATMINRANYVVFMVAGDDKAERLSEVLDGPREPDRLPSQLIRPASGRLVWLVDAAAARLLNENATVHGFHEAVRLAPSILAADFLKLGDEVRQAEAAGADRLHIDVMDGHFVPNISMGPFVVKAVRGATSLPLEVHLMISDPDKYIEAFAKAGADSLIVHQEGNPNLHRTVQAIKGLGKQAGVAINPATPANVIDELVVDLDLVLVMTVNPGFGGQEFIEQTLGKIRRVREIIDERRPGIELEVDGGIDEHTAPKAVRAGARVLVAGSAVFQGAGGVNASMDRIRAAVDNA